MLTCILADIVALIMLAKYREYRDSPGIGKGKISTTSTDIISLWEQEKETMQECWLIHFWSLCSVPGAELLTVVQCREKLSLLGERHLKNTTNHPFKTRPILYNRLHMCGSFYVDRSPLGLFKQYFWVQFDILQPTHLSLVRSHHAFSLSHHCLWHVGCKINKEISSSLKH